MEKIRNFLRKFGLTEVEIDIYLALLESGPNSVLDISKKTKIKRSTVHINVDSLIEKGLLSQTKEGARRKVIAETLEHLGVLLEQRKIRIKRLEKEVPEISKLVAKLSMDRFENESKFDVRYYEGRKGIVNIYLEVMKASELRSYVNISQIFHTFPDNPNLFPEAADKGNLKIWKEIIEDSPRSRQYAKNEVHTGYQYKFFPSKWNLTLFDYMMFNNKVAIVTGKDAVSCVLITNKEFYENSVILFEMMWELLPKPIRI